MDEAYDQPSHRERRRPAREGDARTRARATRFRRDALVRHSLLRRHSRDAARHPRVSLRPRARVSPTVSSVIPAMRRNTSSASGGISAASASASRPDRNTVSNRSRSVLASDAPATSIGGSRSVNVGLTVRVRVPPTGTGTPSTTRGRRRSGLWSPSAIAASPNRARTAAASNNPPPRGAARSHSAMPSVTTSSTRPDEDGTSRVGLVGRGG